MKLRGPLILPFCFLVAGFCSCRLVSEMMHMAPPRVVSFAPSSETPAADSLEEVRIEFSQEMDRTRTEEAFTLLEDQVRCEGCFTWEGPRLRFRPFAGFRENRTYWMSVSVAAEDRFGNSLSEEFSFRFFTGDERVPPEITAHSPADGEVVAEPNRPLILTFSESVDRASLYRSFSISPGVAGGWSWNGESTEAVYSPLESYQPGEEYRVEVDTGLTDTSGNRLTENCIFRFSAQGPARPEVLDLSTADGRITLLPVDQLLLNQGLEKDDGMAVTLSAPVDPARSAGFITVSPGVPFHCDWSDDFTTCSLIFDEPLVWEGVYELGLLDSAYRLQVTGEASRPPEVTRVTFCNDTGAPVFRELVLNQNLGFADSSSACFDFYIEHAAGYGIELGSFLEAFSVDAGGCLTVTPLAVARNPFPPGHTAPDPPADVDTDVLRVYCSLENADNPPGVVTLRLNESLADSNRNRLQQPFALMVNKL